MILHFPTFDILRLALTTGAVPEDVRVAPVGYVDGPDRTLQVEPSVPMPEQSLKALRRLGVQFPKQTTLDQASRAEHWLQLFPLARDNRPTEIDAQTPVLFALLAEASLGELATEILRLGNDRQSFRHITSDAGPPMTLLRVIGPPYYSLLLALEQSDSPGVPIAYREVSPRVWVRIGYAHPLGEHIKPPIGQVLLLSEPRVWQTMPETAWQDIYEVLDFATPATPIAYADAPLPCRIPVSIALTRAGGNDVAELWVLRDPAIAQIEDLVRTADNDLIARFAFAVAQSEGKRTVVLRVRPSKAAPPAIVLDALGYRPYLRIPNLYLPVGTALRPPLRRDAVIALLAEDRTRLTWLAPTANGGFTPGSVPEDAFRPLSEWVDYILDHEHQAMAAWIGSSQFQFESFICRDDAEKPKKPKDPPPPKKPGDGPGKERDTTAAIKPTALPTPKRKDRTDEGHTDDAPKATPSEWEQRLHAVEADYSQLTTPLEDAGRQPLWVEMAQLNGLLARTSDEAICWANAIWEDANPHLDWLRDWSQADGKSLGAAITRLCKIPTPMHADLQRLAASLIHLATLPSVPGDLATSLDHAQRFLEKHESHLGVRPLWLAWHALHKLAGNDVLLLARARDRILERLFAHGLSADLDLPTFLRYHGINANQRFTQVRDKVVRLHRIVRDWTKTGTNPVTHTLAYVDLMFAFGLARLGEVAEARRLLHDAAAELEHADEVHSWLYAAFAFRVQQAIDSKVAGQRLPEVMLDLLREIESPGFLQHLPKGNARDDAKQVQQTLRLKIDRVRQYSRILEPVERIAAYERWYGTHTDELTQSLTALAEESDRAIVIQRLQKLMTGKQKIKGLPNAESQIILTALRLAPRLGQAFGEEVLDRAAVLIAKEKDAERVAELIEKSLFLAGQYDRREDLQRLVTRFQEMLEGPCRLPYDKLIRVVADSFRGLRKFGLRDEILQLLRRVEAAIAGDPDLRGTAVQAGRVVAQRHCLLLELACAWFYFGEESIARKMLDHARDQLYRNELYCVHQNELACGYLTALGYAPIEFAVARVMEFYRKAEGVYDMWTTQTHFSLSRLMAVEATILALVNEDMTLDPQARKRLDEEEYLIRRRIHKDVRGS